MKPRGKGGPKVSERRVRLNVKLGEEVHAALRIQAAVERKSIQDLVSDLIADYVRQRRRKP